MIYYIGYDQLGFCGDNNKSPHCFGASNCWTKNVSIEEHELYYSGDWAAGENLIDIDTYRIKNIKENKEIRDRLHMAMALKDMYKEVKEVPEDIPCLNRYDNSKENLERILTKRSEETRALMLEKVYRVMEG